MKRHFYLQWDSTDNCNLRCGHCYHGDEDSHEQIKQIMTLEESLLMIDDLKETSEKWNMIPRIAISGGECFLRPDLYQILDYTKEKNIITNLLTNGTLIDETRAKDVKARGINTIQISLDGDRETHNRIRRKFYAYDSALKGIRNATNAGIDVVVSMTATKENRDQFEDVVKTAQEYGAKRVAIKTYVPSLELGKNDPLYLDAREIYQVIKNANQLTEKFKGKIDVLHSDVLWQILEPNNEMIEQAKKENKFLWGCSAGYRTLSVLSDGDVYSCRRLPISIGHISEGIEKLVLDSEVMQNLRDMNKMRENTGCDKVVHCRGCRGIAYAITGDYMAKDPMCYKDLVENNE